MIDSHRTLSDPVLGLAAQRVRASRGRDLRGQVASQGEAMRQLHAHLLSGHQHAVGIRVVNDGTQVPAHVAKLSPDGFWTFWSADGSINIDNEQAENGTWVNWTYAGGLG